MHPLVDHAEGLVAVLVQVVRQIAAQAQYRGHVTMYMILLASMKTQMHSSIQTVNTLLKSLA